MHTPTPWVWLGHDYEMAGGAGESVFWVPPGTYQGDRDINENAEFIVKAVNSYDEMVKLLNAVLDEDSSSTALWCEIAGMLKRLGEEP